MHLEREGGRDGAASPPIKSTSDCVAHREYLNFRCTPPASENRLERVASKERLTRLGNQTRCPEKGDVFLA